MDKFVLLSNCQDGTCCLPLRSSAIFISVISLTACLLDAFTDDKEQCSSDAVQYLESFKQLIAKIFQLANLLLLMVTVFEDPALVQLYLCYTMGFVLMALVVALLDFFHKYQHHGTSSVYSFTSEVIFLFVIFRCLPLVDSYRRHITTVPIYSN